MQRRCIIAFTRQQDTEPELTSGCGRTSSLNATERSAHTNTRARTPPSKCDAQRRPSTPQGQHHRAKDEFNRPSVKGARPVFGPTRACGESETSAFGPEPKHLAQSHTSSRRRWQHMPSGARDAQTYQWPVHGFATALCAPMCRCPPHLSRTMVTITSGIRLSTARSAAFACPALSWHLLQSRKARRVFPTMPIDFHCCTCARCQCSSPCDHNICPMTTACRGSPLSPSTLCICVGGSRGSKLGFRLRLCLGYH